MERTIWTTGYSEFGCSLAFSNDGEKLAGQVETFKLDKNISYCVYDKDLANLYCVHEVSEFEDIKNSGAVSRWRHNRDKNTFERQEVHPSGGAGPAHVALDKNWNLLFVTNYDGGSLSFFKLDDEGRITWPPLYTEKMENGGSHIVADRQEASHLHGTFVYKDFAYVIDLGGDKIYHYSLVKHEQEVTVQKGHPPLTTMRPGEGPRHMTIGLQERKAYVLNELQSTIGIFDINEATGELVRRSTVNLDFSGFGCENQSQYGAAIKIHPTNKFLYISNRGLGCLMVFAIKGDALEQVQLLKLNGTWPRDFEITNQGQHLVVADQLAQDLSCLEINQETGILCSKWNVSCPNNPTLVLEL